MNDQEETNEAVEMPEPADAVMDHVAAEAEYGARLVVKRSGTETDIDFEVHSPAVIGRFDPTVGPVDIDLGTIPEGSYVSRKHARLEQIDGVWHVVDMGSSNGTWVLRDEFEKVEDAEIVDGTEIAFGNARFVFHIGS